MALRGARYTFDLDRDGFSWVLGGGDCDDWNARINPTARDRWLLHMRAAVDSLELAPLQDVMLWGYLDRAAFAMVNTFED